MSLFPIASMKGVASYRSSCARWGEVAVTLARRMGRLRGITCQLVDDENSLVAAVVSIKSNLTGYALAYSFIKGCFLTSAFCAKVTAFRNWRPLRKSLGSCSWLAIGTVCATA